MSHRIFLFIIIVLTLGFTGSSDPDSWKRKADMPTARLGLSTCALDGKVYAIGGYTAANMPGLTTVEVYDPLTDTWESCAPMPTGRRQHAACLVDGKIYAIGGGASADPLPTIEVYDPESDSWSSLTGMPAPRFCSYCESEGSIYAIGGALTINPPHPGVSTVEVYTPQ